MLRPTTRVTAFVRIQTESGLDIPFSTVESILSILTANEPGLTRQSITLINGEGRTYLDAGNPALTAFSNNRAREEELSRRIVEKLSWIRGVRVTVNLDEPPPAAAEPTEPRRPVVVTIAPGMSVGLNQAMELGPDEEPLPPEADEVVAPPEPRRRRGEVWVLVPRSYYYHAGLMPDGGHASHEDQVALMQRTESQIRDAVRLILPESDPIDWSPTQVDMILDELPDQRLAEASGAGSRRTSREWALAGAAGAAAAAIVAFGTWILGGRQPAKRPSPSRAGVRYHRGTPGAPAPTERVLEFVRRNPETAFSVLNRWTAQGGGRS